MAFKVSLHPSAARDLRKFGQVEKMRMKKALENLAVDPWKTGKQLHPSDFWSIKSGDYRAIYEINSEQNEVVVLFIGHRKKVYDDFSKLL